MSLRTGYAHSVQDSRPAGSRQGRDTGSLRSPGRSLLPPTQALNGPSGKQCPCNPTPRTTQSSQKRFIVTKHSNISNWKRVEGAGAAWGSEIWNCLAGGGEAGEQLLQAPLDFLLASVGPLQAPGKAAAGLQVEVQQAWAAADHRAVGAGRGELSHWLPEDPGPGRARPGQRALSAHAQLALSPTATEAQTQYPWCP